MLRTFRVLFGRNNGYTDDLGYGALNEQIDQGKRDARLTLAIFSILFVVMTTLSKSMTAGPIHGIQCQYISLYYHRGGSDVLKRVCTSQINISDRSGTILTTDGADIVNVQCWCAGERGVVGE